MVQAITMKRFENSVKESFEDGQSGIVLVMMARGSLEFVQKMLRENYDEWDLQTDRYLNIYLAGYGAYLPPNNKDKNNTRISDTDLFFNNRAFKTFKDNFYSNLGLEYDDRIEIFLLNYFDNRLQYNNAIRIDLIKSVASNQDELRKLMAFIRNLCCNYSNTNELKNKLRSRKVKKISKTAFSSLVIDGIKIVFSFL